MTRYREYASPLTKDYLIKAGITWVDEETLTVYGEKGPITPILRKSDGYLMINLYELDKDGNRIKLPTKYKYMTKDGTIKYSDSYCYKARSIGLHRILWCWLRWDIPAGIIIDHKDNHHYQLHDYRLDNLQPITPAQNIAKERIDSNTKVVKAGKYRDIAFYEKKLEYYLEEYEKAKKEHNADKAHKMRSNISNQRAKIRYLLRGNNE